MKYRLVILAITILTMTSGCMYAIRYDGPYRGKVVDADTREPIEGAVVLGTWSVLHPNVAGGYHTYYDARETVTNKNGEFVIPGQGLRIMSNLEPAQILIFRVGYNYKDESWDSLKIDLYSKDKIDWKNDMPVIPIRKFNENDRKSLTIPNRPDVPERLMKLLTIEINKERKIRGFEPFEVGVSNE